MRPTVEAARSSVASVENETQAVGLRYLLYCSDEEDKPKDHLSEWEGIAMETLSSILSSFAMFPGRRFSDGRIQRSGDGEEAFRLSDSVNLKYPLLCPHRHYYVNKKHYRFSNCSSGEHNYIFIQLSPPIHHHHHHYHHLHHNY